MYFRNYGRPKTWLDTYQKTTASDHTWTRKMVNLAKRCSNLSGGILSYLFITVKAANFGKRCLSDMQNLKTVCSHIHCL